MARGTRGDATVEVPFALPARLRADLADWAREAASAPPIRHAADICPALRWRLRGLPSWFITALPPGLASGPVAQGAPVVEWVALHWDRAASPPAGGIGRALQGELVATTRAWERTLLVVVPATPGPWAVIDETGALTAVNVIDLAAFEATLTAGMGDVFLRVLVVGAGNVAPWQVAGWAGVANTAGAFHRLVAWRDEIGREAVSPTVASWLQDGLVAFEGPVFKPNFQHAPRDGWFGAVIFVLPTLSRGAASGSPHLFPPLVARVVPMSPPPMEPEALVDVLLGGLEDALEAIKARPDLVWALGWIWPRLKTGTEADHFRPRLARIVRDHVRTGTSADADVPAVARNLRFHRVGVALSGGGATAFRALPVLQHMAAQGVPVDVIVGVSGGAVVAALHAADPVNGVASATQGLAPDRLSLASTAAILGWARPLVRWLEAETGVGRGGTLGQTRLPCYPVSVRVGWGAPLQGGGGGPRRILAPDLVAGVTWGLGQAVLASGAAPFAIPPVADVSGIFQDGGVRTMLPSDALPACGADFTIGLRGLAIGYTRRVARTMMLGPSSRGTQALGALLAFADVYMDEGMDEVDVALAPSGRTSVTAMLEAVRFGRIGTTAYDWPADADPAHAAATSLTGQLARLVARHQRFVATV